ncbi:MAG: lysophospholipid acyltransferase family protein [Gammaproteobacteria bacterium]|nr:lysophospholipid acyltransferase family protein [Gammaproteobacteria bacterium]
MRFLRSALVPVTMPLAVIIGIPVLLFTGSRRKAINFCTALWADMASALIGLKVDVTGEEHLRSPRPAVFILNHQSNADGFLVAKLIRRDIAYLGKQELSRQPIRGRLMQLGGLVLVDRKNPSAANRATQALIDAIRKDGRSVAIFPEGTRSHSTTLRRFKKGAFLIALRAGVPMVPIVIHNSIDAQPEGESAFRPATVRVDVLPPLDTSQWKVKTLAQHMADVRALFLEALGQSGEEA